MASEKLSPNQEAFAQYLAGLWGYAEQNVTLSSSFPGYQSDLLHSYTITRARHWKPWKALHSEPVGHWWCRTLKEAADNYSWPESSPGKSFEELSIELKRSLAEGDDERAHKACLEIFLWGGVARKPTDKSRIWVNERHQQKSLCSALSTAVSLLEPGSGQPLDAFDGKTLLMNSAMTKIYAAADPDNIIIYDGRVGAALGLLARYWLVSQQLHSLPSDLAFTWGDGAGKSSRNPSEGQFIFPRFDYSASVTVLSNQCWAYWVRTASELFQQMKTVNTEIPSLGQIERAMFMIGYSVQFEAPDGAQPEIQTRSQNLPATPPDTGDQRGEPGFGKNVIDSLWDRIQIEEYPTPTGRNRFRVTHKTASSIRIRTLKSPVTISRESFEAAVNYLHDHRHYAGSKCRIGSSSNHKITSEFCMATRRTSSGRVGPRVITYVLPVLQSLGVVEIDASTPTSTWLKK